MTIRVVTTQEILNSLAQEDREVLALEWRNVVYETTEISPEDVEVLWQSYAGAPSEVPMTLTVDFVKGTIVHNFDVLSFSLRSGLVRALLREKVPRMKIMFAGGLVADREVEN
jgi:hypothetical protein